MNKINDLIYSKKFGMLLVIALVVLCILGTYLIKTYGMVEIPYNDEYVQKFADDRHNN